MAHRIDVCLKQSLIDPAGRRIAARIDSDLGFKLDELRVADSFIIDMDIELSQLEVLAKEVFVDPVIQKAAIDEPLNLPFDWIVEVGYRPGVTDNVGRTAREAVERTLNIEKRSGGGIYSRKIYFFRGQLERDQIEAIARDLLANNLIQTSQVFSPIDYRYTIFAPVVTSKAEISVGEIDLEQPDEELLRISHDGVLALNIEEMRAIQAFFKDAFYIAQREQLQLSHRITDCELEVLAQTWSEHCKHKIFNAIIEYEEDGKKFQINSLFRSYVQRATEDIRKKLGPRDYCLSVFKDNAGVIKIDDDWNLVIKVETHNSPSALDPYGGALTGIVGVNRDPFGTGLGCRLIFNTDVFCFAPPNFSGSIPPRLLHPKRVFEGVREGVEHGGNKSGIPTVNGAVVFDERYLGKPLVYCGTGGLMPARINGKPAHVKQANPGDRIVMTGGRIGKDGIHGATFSSEELHEGSPATAVQIGDPITQKRMTDFLLVARDRGLYSSITDNGAGGLSSSVGEMARESGGARILLDRAPLKYPGLQPWEILLSEAQERMTVAVPPAKLDEFLNLADKMDVEATDLGEFTNDGSFTVMWKDSTVVFLPLDFLHDGVPQMRLKATWERPKTTEPEFECPSNLNDQLLGLMSRWNICSKERLIRQYDHEVQAGSVVKPLVGSQNDGPSDAAVQRPMLDRYVGVAIGCGIAPKYSDIDTYWMMAAVIDEAVRNIVAVGANPDHMAGLDNFCWCDPVKSEKTPDGEYKLAQLVRANKALYDFCVAYQIPCVSGKDSMKNDYSIGGSKISIPPTVLFTAVGVVPDVRKAVTADFKQADDLIYLLGTTRDELGASEYFASEGFVGSNVPKVLDSDKAIRSYRALFECVRQGLVRSIHDLSDGGLGVALAESCFSGGLGARIDLTKVEYKGILRDDFVLFSETPCRFLISVFPHNKKSFEKSMEGFDLSEIGRTTSDSNLFVRGLNGQDVVDNDIRALKKAWQEPLGV